MYGAEQGSCAQCTPVGAPGEGAVRRGEAVFGGTVVGAVRRMVESPTVPGGELPGEGDVRLAETVGAARDHPTAERAVDTGEARVRTARPDDERGATTTRLGR
ncbi:hypothetical protein GCM10018791_52950 [Streptomyces zaomyceticus]|nr:hypothetical protein GCM10018791_52950 [Streptomyces zaomyceticus]